MEGDVCSFPPESSDDRSQRGSVASSATLSHSQDVLIYLFGDSAVHLSVEGLGNVTVQELGRSVREALHVPECAQDTFAFWLSSPLLVDDAISLTLEFDRFFLGNIKLLHLIVWRLVSESYWKSYNFSLVLNGLEVLFGSQGGTKFLGRNQELQLKARHQPYKVCRQWQDLLYRFTEASEEDISQDEPCLQYRRNVFYPKFKELQIEDEGVLRLLYEEAKHNIITGRYPCDPEHWASLGGLSLALDEGIGLERQKLTSAIREKKLSSFLPAHVAMASGGLFSTLRGKSSRQAGLEQSLLEEYRKINISVDCQQDSELIHQYLRTCHSLPYYGCAFFDGEIDKPAQGILQRVKRKAVAVGISLEGVYVMDVKDKHVLLGLRFYELSWDHSSPEEEGDSHILWLEFDGDEDGTPVNKLLKIYSKQAELMSGFIEFCVELRSVSEGGAAAEIDGDSSRSQQASGKDDGEKHGRGGRRGMLRRQSSVVCSRVHSLNTINYVDNGKEIKCLKPKRAASFFTRQTSGPMYSSVQGTESSEQG